MLQRTSILVKIRRRAVIHVRAWTPEEIGRRFNHNDLRRRTRFDLPSLSGVKVTQVVQTIGGWPMPGEAARLLGGKTGSPATRMTRTTLDARGDRVVMH